MFYSYTLIYFTPVVMVLLVLITVFLAVLLLILLHRRSRDFIIVGLKEADGVKEVVEES